MFTELYILCRFSELIKTVSEIGLGIDSLGLSLYNISRNPK